MGKSATQTYTLKDTTTRMNGNAKRYTASQLEWVRTEMKEMLHFFGYAKLEHDLENPTGFFEYANDDSEMLR